MSTAFDQQYLWHPYSAPPRDTLAPNLLVKKAHGVHLTLEDDSEVIDAMSSWWCAIHGYNHPAINQAIEKQLQNMSHVMFGGLTHQPAIDLGEKLLNITPPSLDKIFYSDSGSVSVEVAMKMAVQYQAARGKQDKNQFITIRCGYHGDTWKAMSVCDPDAGMHHIFNNALRKEFFVDQPTIKFADEWNNDPQQNSLQDLADTLEQHADSICALILEPVVQGAGGMHFYHPEYLNQCHALCQQYDVLLIFDEIATGFGRTGKLFATDFCQIEPDILCLGKALTGGYLSFAATLTNQHIADTIGKGEAGIFMHGPTFMANPLACSAAIASLDLLADQQWQSSVSNIEQQLIEQLAPAKNFKTVKQVRVLGAIGVIEMKKTVDANIAKARCQELGVWLRPFGNNIYCMPPFIIQKDKLTQVCNAMLALAQG